MTQNKSKEFEIKNSTEEHFNEINRITEIRYGNETYKIWSVKLINSLVVKFLKEKYPNSLIVRGIIDYTIFDNKSDDIIPVEIQKTAINNRDQTFNHHSFEDQMRRQVEGNIVNYSKCWLFMDSEYLRFLQSEDVGKNINIDLTWIIKLMRENTLKVFAIKYDGTVQELTTKDFDFLKNISQVCSVGENNDERILTRNKLKIQRNVLFGHKFIQEEISRFENEFDNRADKNIAQSNRYFMKSDDEKCRLYGNILYLIANLSTTNNMLSCTLKDKLKRTINMIILGIFEQNDFNGNDRNANIQFIDKFNIAQYFPGYIRNKQLWDYCKKTQRIFTMNEFRGIVEGTFNYDFIKKQSTLLDY